MNCLIWLNQKNYIGVTISLKTIGWPLIQSCCLAVTRWYDGSDVEWCCCLLLCVDAGYIGIKFKISWIKTKRHHTNLKTIFFCMFRSGKIANTDLVTVVNVWDGWIRRIISEVRSPSQRLADPWYSPVVQWFLFDMMGVMSNGVVVCRCVLMQGK